MIIKEKCRKCKKIIKVEAEILNSSLGSIISLRNIPDCGNHRQEFELVKDKYACYVDFLYNKPKKEIKI